MSVLRSKRHIAETEFEHTFSELYAYSMEHTAAVSKRRKKWLCTNIDLHDKIKQLIHCHVNVGTKPLLTTF